MPVTRCHLIKSVTLDSYYVGTLEGAYVLRIYPHGWQSLSQIAAELSYLLYLGSQGLSISVPVPRPKGQLYFQLNAPEGTRYAALFTYAEGKSLAQNLTPTTARDFGRLLGQVHKHSDTLPEPLARPPLDAGWLLELPLQHLEAALDYRQEDLSYLRWVIGRLLPKLAALPTQPPQYGPCHGDPVAENVHISDEGKLTLFDFDLCGPGWRIYDLAVFLQDKPPEIAQAFLEGYRQLLPFTKKELELVPLFQVARNIWVLGMRARFLNQWGSAHFSDEFVTAILNTVRATMSSLDPAEPGRRKAEITATLE